MEKVEKVRNEMHELIMKYGTNDVRVVEKSQELDRVLNEYEKGKYVM